MKSPRTALRKGKVCEMPKAASARSAKKTAVLSRTILFANMADPVLERLSGLAEWRSIGAGAAIFRRGDPGEHLFVVHTGRVRIGSGAGDGREVTLSLLGPGDVFGELAFADGGPRTADAVAVESVELLSLARRDLLPFLLADPQAMLHMMSALAARARWISQNYEDAAFLHLPQRLAKRILFLQLHFGLDTAAGRRLSVSLPHRELASHMNVTRESINRLIQKWRKDGVVEERRGILTITDISKLRAIAGVN